MDLTGQRFGQYLVIGPKRVKLKSGSHRTKWECVCSCGDIRIVGHWHLMSGNSRGCRSCTKKGSNNPNWGNGRKRETTGYISILNLTTGVYTLEHHLVMSEHLGRPLTSEETVHHKNGVRDDNRLENLELWSSRHPKGQRIADKVIYAKEILALYEPQSLHTSH